MTVLAAAIAAVVWVAVYPPLGLVLFLAWCARKAWKVAREEEAEAEPESSPNVGTERDWHHERRIPPRPPRQRGHHRRTT
jgi:hypothetical protein